MEPRSLHRVGDLLETLERATGEPGKLANTLQCIAETARNFFAADDCVIYAINPITDSFIESLMVADNQVESKTLLEQPQPGGITRQILQQGMLLIEQLSEVPEYDCFFTQSRHIQAFAGLALYTKYGSRPLGVLYLDFKDSRQFSSDDHELFQIFAGQASYILQATWLVRRYREVARIGQEINEGLATVPILFQKLQQHVAGILDTSYVFLLAIYTSPVNTLEIYLSNEGNTLTYNNRSPKGIMQYIINKQETFFSKHISNDKEHFLFFSDTVPEIESGEAVIFVPLVLHGVTLGLLSIQHPKPDNYNEEDRFILELLGNHIALALYNMRLYDSLARLNETGQFLTQQIDSSHVLQETADKICRATEANSVILYAYDSVQQHFILPPSLAGTLLDLTPLHTTFLRPHDIAVLALQYTQPIFAKEGASIYTTLSATIRRTEINFQQRENIQSVAIMPLFVGEIPMGVLFLNFCQPQYFDAPQISLIEGLAHYAAIAIKNSQTFGTLSKRRIRELEILQNIDRELSRTLNLNQVLDIILKLGYEHVPAEEASILLCDPQSSLLKTAAAIGRHAETSQKQVISLRESKAITRWVVENKKPARVKNVHREVPWRDLHFPVADDTLSELDVPILDGEEIAGVLNFESTREGAFNEEAEMFLTTLAGQAVLAINKAKAYEREKRLAADFQALNHISQEIISQLESTRIFDLILDKALELTRCTRGNLMLYDPRQNDLQMVAARNIAEGKSGQRQRLDQGIVGYAARHKRLLNVDLSRAPWNEINLDFFPGTLTELAVPMLAKGELRGVLNVESSISHHFGEIDERLLQGLADLAVIALQNAESYEREKRSATESQALNEISKKIAMELDPVTIFQFILKKALQLTESTVGSLHLYNPDLHDLIMVAKDGIVEEMQGRHQELGTGVVGYAAKQRQMCNVEDVSQPPWNTFYIEFTPGVRSELAVPLLEGDELRGVLNVENLVPGHFKEPAERLLKALADLAVVAIQNTERYKKSLREAFHTEMLYRAGKELADLNNWTQIEQAYDAILRIAEEHSPCQIVIRRYEDITQDLLIIRASSYQNIPPFSRMKLDEGLNGQVARELRTWVIHDTWSPPKGAVLKLSDTEIRSLLITPLRIKNRYYGNLSLGHKEPGYFRGSEVSFFEGLADQLANTIYRLETIKARQDFEKISSFGQSAFELTHRLANDLGLFEFYLHNIQSQMAKRQITDGMIDENLAEIARSVRKVLTFSKQLKQELDKQEEEASILVFPQELLEDAKRTSSLPTSIQMDIQVGENIGAVNVIRKQIADILHNLITNAIDAMPGGGTITLLARNSGRFVALEVIDTGIGIPVHEQKRIFELSHSSKGSSGFGLWSALLNAQRNKGDLRVKSRPGRTVFTLLLPRTDQGII